MKIVAPSMPNAMALELEVELKKELRNRGFSLIDAEDDRAERKRRAQAGINAMPVDEKGRRVSAKKGTTYGRQEKHPANFKEVYARQQRREITLKEAMAEVGVAGLAGMS